MSDFTVRKLLRELPSFLPVDGGQNAVLALLALVLDQPREALLAHDEQVLSVEAYSRFSALFARLQQGEPLPYLTGHKAFFGLDFAVSPAVLIPRPETELLVEEALTWLTTRADVSIEAIRGLDIGTGSGCIALSLSVNCPFLQMTAVDLSSEALALAQENARSLAVEERICFLQADLFPQAGEFDLICSNPPYIPSERLASVNSLPWEPRLALDGGADGLCLIERILDWAPAHLRRPGLLLVETEAGLGAETLALGRGAFPQERVELLHDYAGRERLLRVELGSEG